jgi:phospholipid/cholesterol/gamma-HCH transport system substrate-binding protein
MRRSGFGVYQFNQAVGLVVLSCAVLFLAAAINAGLLKEWFQTSLTLRVLLPQSGVGGLSAGSAVMVMGARAGEVRRIVIEPGQRMHAEARIERQMQPFIRSDSQVFIRRQFAIAGNAYLDISRGEGGVLDWHYAVLSAVTDRAPTDSLTQVVDELHARLIPLIEELQKAAASFTRAMDRSSDPAGPLMRTLDSSAAVAARIEKGEGMLGRLVGDEKMAASLQATLSEALSAMGHANNLMADLERTSKDARIPAVIQRTEQVLASLQTTARHLAAASPQIPQITGSLSDSTQSLPAIMLQAQTTARELELLLAQMRRTWLFGGGGGAPPAQRRAPATEVRP